MARVTRENSREKMLHNFTVGIIVGLDASGRLVAQTASELAPVDTGRLARSIHAGDPFEISELFWAIDVGTNVEYARAHELGSGIHALDPAERELIVIEPVNAKALAFEWPSGPKNISAYDPETGLFFFSRVYHPGVPAHPYLRPALEATRDEVRQIMTSSVAAEVAR